MSAPRVERQTVAGLMLGVNRIGQGPPVVFLHGWGAEIMTVFPAAQQLSMQGFTCHTLDLPGFGASAMPPEPWGVPQYAEFVRAYLRAEDLTRVRLVGHSFGGRISLVFAAEYPEMVEQMVLVNSAGVRLPPSPRLRAYYAGRRVLLSLLRVPGLRRWEPAARAWMRQRFGSADYQDAGPLVETFKRVVNQDLRNYARRVQAPTLLIWGELDEDTPLEIARILERTIPDAGLVVWAGAGHYAYLDRLPEFVRVVSHFFGANT
ncbi:MAG: alpha/beta fold hydrolase [Anaerolineales bacterium]